jgi:hypothetical protein
MPGVPLLIADEHGLARFADCALPGPSGGDHGLLMVPPLVIVRADVSWQVPGMSRWAGLVLS